MLTFTLLITLNANYLMWDFICNWLPIIAFVTGTALGWLINALFERVRRKHLEKLYQNSSNANIALESQLTSKSILEEDLGRTNSELEKLRKEVQDSRLQQETPSVLDIENKKLRQKIDKLKLKQTGSLASGSKNHVTEYQAFLSDLEKSIKKAKKKATSPNKVDIQKKDKKKKKKSIKPSKKEKASKKIKKKKSKDKFEFYKQKFANKTIPFHKTTDLEVNKDLSFLHGITEEISEILKENGITSFKDLSNTKIAELRGILALAGEKYEKIDPLNWPIQARIADKGQWEILDEYKSKMKM